MKKSKGGIDWQVVDCNVFRFVHTNKGVTVFDCHFDPNSGFTKTGPLVLHVDNVPTGNSYSSWNELERGVKDVINQRVFGGVPE